MKSEGYLPCGLEDVSPDDLNVGQLGTSVLYFIISSSIILIYVSWTLRVMTALILWMPLKHQNLAPKPQLHRYLGYYLFFSMYMQGEKQIISHSQNM